MKFIYCAFKDLALISFKVFNPSRLYPLRGNILVAIQIQNNHNDDEMLWNIQNTGSKRQIGLYDRIATPIPLGVRPVVTRGPEGCSSNYPQGGGRGNGFFLSGGWMHNNYVPNCQCHVAGKDPKLVRHILEQIGTCWCMQVLAVFEDNFWGCDGGSPMFDWP